MTHARSWTTILSGLLLLAGFAFGQQTLTILTHWGEESQRAPMEQMIATCEAATGISANVRAVPFGDLYTTIVTGRAAGIQPDIYHLYNLWLPEFTGEGGMLAAPPQEAVDHITANVAPAIVEGISAGGQVWGYPTEVNTYLLIYNKRLLEEAGYDAPPSTWDELKEIAAAITQIDASGAVTQVGFGVLPGWDSGVVHPWTSLLLSNGGEYLDEDMTATAFDSPEGVETLQLYADLLENGGMDMSVAGWELPNGIVGMVVMANWWRATLRASEAIDYDTEVGVAPVPVGPSGSQSMTLSYNWLWSVDASSANQDAAWEFLGCLNTEVEPGHGSPSGQFLIDGLGAIPSFVYDQEAHAEALGDFFLQAFVDSTHFARPEPVVAGGQEVKTILQGEIESVLIGATDPASALQVAAIRGDDVLEEMQR
jgi:multiple sugar transport system substrate-binding protein